jgi:aminomethyltransferase
MKTKFYNCHLKHNAKMVEFAGYQMPIQYSSIIAEHKAVRNSVGVFDVSHMGEIFVRGEKALDFVQHITINDAAKLFPGRVQYSAMCYEDGGIVDDLLVYMISKNEYLLVINASNIEKDFNWMKKQNIFNVELVNESEKYSLLAIQGPNSKNVIQKIFDFTIDLEYYHFIQCKILGMDMFLSRTGYTGELGYEIYFKGSESEAELLWEKIFESGKAYDIQPVGLGARDSLRLEMGFCLYGNDIDQHTNPLEAGLGWITKLNKANFIAKDVLVKIKSDGLNRKLTPLITDEKAFPRHGYDVTYNSNKVGYITSGTVSPILEKGIALAYIDFNYVSDSAEFCFLIRGKEISARVTKLPFVKK